MTRTTKPAPASMGFVTAVSLSPGHTMAKENQNQIHLIEGKGVAGDAHAGRRVKHRSRVAVDPDQPNLRQVHLIHAELHDELASRGFVVSPGEMGENITTRGIDLLGLPRQARLRFGRSVVVEITGLRNPCTQLEGIHAGLMAATLDRDANGLIVRKAGVMGIVVSGGEIVPGDPIQIVLPSGIQEPLDRV